MNKYVKLAAAALAVGMAVALAGCDGCSGCAGCGGNVKNNTVTNSNWFAGTSYKGIQPSFILDEKHPEYTKEEIVYDVTFDGTTASNSSYSVEYKDGTFVTEFYATEYDWNSTEIPEGYKADKKEIVYFYRTQLNISVRYTLKKDSSQSEWFENSVVTQCYFRSADANLQPVYSSQQLNTTSPNEARKAKTLADAYTQVNAVYENFYNFDCTEITSFDIKADGTKQSKVYNKLNKLKKSLFDNSSLYIAVRSMKLNASLSQAINAFSAADGKICDYAVVASSAQLGAEERAAISKELAKPEVGLYVPITKDAEGNDVEDAGIKSVAVNISNVGGALQSLPQTIWYAAIENADNNVSRATMLKISTPLSFGLGTLNYTLKEVKSTLWNK